MRSLLQFAVVAALAAAATLNAKPAAAVTGVPDGHWSVLVITERGDCDRAYRYALRVANGHVSYDGDAKVNMAGTVTPAGLVNVSIRLGSKGAEGTGQLSGGTGAGTWHGIGPNATCAGRWEAERH